MKLLSKRIFSCLLAMTVLLSMMPINVWGGSTTKSDSSVAEVTIRGTTTYYDNISEAVTAAGTSTIKLIKDVTEAVEIADAITRNIDLNGYTWSSEGDVLKIKNNGIVNLSNGKIKSNTGRGIYMEYGKVTLNNMTVKGGTAIELARDVDNTKLVLSDDTYLIGGLMVYGSKTLADYLPSGKTFVTCSYDNSAGTATKNSDVFVATAYTSNQYTGNLALVNHTHLFIDGKCTCGAAYVASLTSNGETTLIKELNSGVLWKSGELKLFTDAEITYSSTKSTEYTLNKSGQELTIDLNGHKLNGNLVMGSGATLTMKDGSANASGEMTGYLRVNGGTLNIESGIYQYNDTPYNQGAITYSGGKLNISGGTFKKNSNSNSLRFNSTFDENNVSITGGTFEGIYVSSVGLDYWYPLTKGTYCFRKNDNNLLILPKDTQYFNDTVSVQTCSLHTWKTEGNGSQYRCSYCCAINPNGLPEGTVAKIGTGNFYTSLTNAIGAVNSNAATGEIVQVADTNGENVTVSSGDVTINLNNKTWCNSYSEGSSGEPALKVAGGTVTVRNGCISAVEDNTVAPAVVIENGTFNVGTGTTLSGTNSNETTGQKKPALEVSGGNVNLAIGTVLKNGIKVTATGKVAADYLPSGCAFAKCNADDNLTNSDTPEIVNAYTNADGTACTSLIENLKVVEHTHSYADNNGVYKCACGYVCEHKNEINSATGCCPDCGDFVAQASVTANNVPAYYLTVQAAISAANGRTVKILSDVDSITVSKQASLDLNSKTVDTIEITAGNLTVSGAGKINTLNIGGGALNISDDNVEVGSLTVSGGTVSLSRGKFSSITVADNVKIKDILANGYGFKTGENVWASEAQLDSKSIANVTVKQLPIQSLTYDKNININYGQKATLAVTPEKASGAGDVTYKWYSGTSLISGETDSTLEISDLTVNKDGYTYCVEATCDGYTYKSENITVTVNKVAPTYKTTPTGKANLSYTGTAQELITAGSTEDGTIKYRVDNQTTDSVSTATNAGTYTVYYRIIGDENHNDSGEQSIEVRIAPMKLKGIVKPENSAIAKTFDGTTSASLSSVKFCNEENSEIKINSDLYEITDVHFNDANAGNDKSLYFTVKLKSNNYILSTNKDLATEETYNCNGYSISKATAPILENVKTSLKYADTAEQTVSVAGKMPANAGTLTCAKGTTDQINYVDSWNVGEDGTVTYTISGANAGTEITLPVKISSTNYNDATVNVVISITRATPTGMPYYENITASGKTLADAKLSVKDAAGNNLFSTAGEVAWKDGNDKSVEQGAEYEWIFTPTDTNYETITGKTILWAKQASGGGGAATPAEEEVITVKDNTASETTTMTTVKDAKVETVKNEQGEEISKITATVSEKVAEKLVNQAISNKSDTVEITVKSNNGNKVDGEKQIELEIPKKTVESIAKDTDATLVIKGDNGQVNLDNKTLEVIASETTGEAVRIVVNENTGLKEEQKPAADAIGESGKVFDIQAVVGNKVICDFKGGKVHITLHVPERLKGKEIAVIYISDKGVCETLDYIKQTAGGNEYVEFVTTHFLNFAIVEKADAEKLIEKQNADKINSLIKEVKLKATTSKTSKKNVKVKVSVRNNSSLIKEAKTMGYTVKYKFYRSTKKTSKYKAAKTKTSNIYINTKGKKGSKYYYKAKVLVYDGKKFVSQSTLKQCSYGVRRWSK